MYNDPGYTPQYAPPQGYYQQRQYYQPREYYPNCMRVHVDQMLMRRTTLPGSIAAGPRCRRVKSARISTYQGKIDNWPGSAIVPTSIRWGLT